MARTGFAQDKPDAVLNLLAIVFETGEPPGGTVRLTFSGGAAIRLEVECVEAEMRDLGPRWAAKAKPGHALDESTALHEG